MRKRFIAGMVTAALLLVMLPATALAANEETYDISAGSVTIDNSCGSSCAGHTITGSSTSNTITVRGAHTIILSGVSIDVSSDNQGRPLDLEYAGETTVTLASGTTNTLKAGWDAPGIFVPNGSKVTFNGMGTLNVAGGGYWPGIGRNGNGNIQIDSGTITSEGGECASGIGGSWGFDGGNIVINGGMVTARGYVADISG